MKTTSGNDMMAKTKPLTTKATKNEKNNDNDLIVC